MRLLIVGPQGAGKGTQAELLAEAVGVGVAELAAATTANARRLFGLTFDKS